MVRPLRRTGRWPSIRIPRRCPALRRAILPLSSRGRCPVRKGRLLIPILASSQDPILLRRGRLPIPILASRDHTLVQGPVSHRSRRPIRLELTPEPPGRWVQGRAPGSHRALALRWGRRAIPRNPSRELGNHPRVVRLRQGLHPGRESCSRDPRRPRNPSLCPRC